MQKVLMVDDDDAMLFAFKKLCTQSGVQANTASSLESALLLLSKNPYDILISDLNLTGAHGQEGLKIVRAAKRHNPSIRTYIWTAYDGKNVRSRAIKAGVVDFLTKPVKFDTLLKLINNGSSVHSSAMTA